jgi:hypothetical protein
MGAMSDPTDQARRRTPAARRAEEFLARVLPGSEAAPEERHDADVPRPAGVDERTQALLEAMGGPDRESW